MKDVLLPLCVFVCALRVHAEETALLRFVVRLSVLRQPPRCCPPLVPHPAQSSEAPGVRPVQVADHQDRHGAPAAGHPGPFPLQHARIHGEENAGRLRAKPNHFFFFSHPKWWAITQ